ncbi:hypothetical protein ABZZ74_40220 [Streptomyces sp. NPDC006476]|uniref:hypothetical protein n=1 Tax=Streptomyces sp. NPDC006476 TaxID=3157175 RepID=UPI0033AA4840
MTVTAAESSPGDSFTDVTVNEVTRIPEPTVLPSSTLAKLNEETPTTDRPQESTKRVRNNSFRRIERRRDSKQFIPLARWEGTVIERYETYFVAEVIDLNTDESATAEFEIGEVTPGDLHLCEPGALFYWTIGYDVKEGGQRSRTSVLHFRRLGRIAD